MLLNQANEQGQCSFFPLPFHFDKSERERQIILFNYYVKYKNINKQKINEQIKQEQCIDIEQNNIYLSGKAGTE